jgi:D-psicose/D-tagatose/L-ribulose 3-epimerase
MKFGVNTFVWVSPFKTELANEMAMKVKALGFDILEIAVENPRLIDTRAVKSNLEKAGVEGLVCGAFGPDRNLCSFDASIRENAKTYIRWLIDFAAEIGSPTVSGPMYSAVGKDHLEDENDRRKEWQLAVEGMREMADYAGSKNVKLAFEPLNRFETDLINTVGQGLELINEIDRDNVGFHLDTFHMHLEEKSSGTAIRAAGDRIFHFHACENDRGVPGSGQVRWDEIASALKDVGYDGPVVIESFTPQVKEITRAVCIWREIAPSQDAIASQGLKYLKSLLA